MELPAHDLTRLATFLENRSVSSLQLTQAYLDRIERYNPHLRAFLAIQPESALEQARTADQRRLQGNSRSPWDGIPIAVKDILCTRDLPTTCASRMLQGFQSPYDATAIQRLHANGFVLLGKTNLDEFAMGGSTETGCFGPTSNPWNTSLTAGGSSGGSAAAVAARLTPASLGTDTGGSIRLPASFCGICGLKPTYGRISRYGQVAFASSLDQIGPMTNTVEDLAAVLHAISGHCPRDATSLNLPPVDIPSFTTSHLAFSKLRLGVVREQMEDPGLDPEIQDRLLSLIHAWEKAGHSITWLSMPIAKYGISAYYVIAPCEASSNLSRFDGVRYGHRAPASTPTPSPNGNALFQMYADSRSQGFGEEVKRRLMLGTFALSAGYYDAYYKKALQVRRLLSQAYTSAFQQVDLIVGPTSPGPPFRLGEKSQDPIQMYLVDLYTVGANLAGIPAMSLPLGLDSRQLPLGIQLQAPPLQEASLLLAAHAIHQQLEYQPLFPPDLQPETRAEQGRGAH